MKTKLSAPFLAVDLLLGGNAQADFIDTFSVIQGPLFAFNPSNNPLTDTQNAVAGLGLPNANRTLSADVLNSPVTGAINTSISGGNFNVAIGTTTDSTSFAKLEYTFPSFNLATVGTAFALHVLNADDDFRVAWYLNNVLTVTTDWTVGSNFDVIESFSQFNPAALAAATQLTLEISAPDRTPGNSPSISFSSLETIPEPGTLSLMALGLAGFGWSRRKSTN